MNKISDMLSREAKNAADRVTVYLIATIIASIMTQAVILLSLSACVTPDISREYPSDPEVQLMQRQGKMDTIEVDFASLTPSSTNNSPKKPLKENFYGKALIYLSQTYPIKYTDKQNGIIITENINIKVEKKSVKVQIHVIIDNLKAEVSVITLENNNAAVLETAKNLAKKIENDLKNQ